MVGLCYLLDFESRDCIGRKLGFISLGKEDIKGTIFRCPKAFYFRCSGQEE